MPLRPLRLPQDFSLCQLTSCFDGFGSIYNSQGLLLLYTSHAGLHILDDGLWRFAAGAWAAFIYMEKIQ